MPRRAGSTGAAATPSAPACASSTRRATIGSFSPNGSTRPRAGSAVAMSEWQQILRDSSVATLEQLAERFGRDVIDVEALKPAFDNFQMRITPEALNRIKAVGDPMWRQYVPTVEEL